jgi:tRNA(Ile2) C34 agmatinyltransferase TiaS
MSKMKALSLFEKLRMPYCPDCNSFGKKLERLWKGDKFEYICRNCKKDILKQGFITSK